MIAHSDTILIVDDNVGLRSTRKTLPAIFTKWNVVCASSVNQVIGFLKQESFVPKIMLIDAFGSTPLDGAKDFLRIAKWLKKNRSGLMPEYLAFSSVESAYARACKKEVERRGAMPADKIYFFDFNEIGSTAFLLLDIFSDSFVSSQTWNFNQLVNRALKKKLPTSYEQMDRYRIRHNLVNARDAEGLYRGGVLPAKRAMEIWAAQYKRPFSSDIGVRIHENELNRHNPVLRFAAGSGGVCRGRAVFTIEDAEAMRDKGGYPVLIVKDFDPT